MPNCSRPTVREAASYTALEALDGNVVDFIADHMDSLLSQLDGRTAQTPAGPVIVETRGLVKRDLEKNLLENLLEFLADPNVSFLLLTIGGLGIVIELFNPGLIVPVVVGVIFLILAFVALGNLPVNWAGVALHTACHRAGSRRSRGWRDSVFWALVRWSALSSAGCCCLPNSGTHHPRCRRCR